MTITGEALRVVRRALPREGGYSFVELIVVAAIVLVLATAVLPLSKVGIQRQKEVELRRALREMRTAIDRYKDAADLQQISNLELEPDDMGYPPDLETLVKGVTKAGDATQTQVALPAPHPDRPADRRGRVGPAVVPGSSRVDVLGRAERVRRVLDSRRDWTRWHSVQRVVR